MTDDNDLRAAGNPLTAPERLCELSRADDPGVRRRVAANPNTPPDTLERLWLEFPEAFHANPVVPLMLVVEPMFVTRLDPDALRAVVLASHDDGRFLELAAKHRSREVRQAIVQHPAAPGELLVRLAKEYFFYEEVAEHPNTPRAYLEEMSRHPWASVRRAAVRNPNLPDDLRAVLLEDEDPHIRAAAAGRSSPA